MAPPVPGLAGPPAARRRSAGDVVAGVLAILALTALTAGVPITLIMVLGLPFPHATPALSLLTHQVGILTIIRIMSVVVWLAWIQLVCCVLAEIRAAIRNVGMPARIPLAGGTQAVVHRLVSTALLFSATSALSPAFAGISPPPAAVALLARTQAHPQPRPEPADSGQAVTTAASQAVTASQDPVAEKIYVVQPPVGRFHQSLWEIAEDHLGNGLRYREIFEMNKGRLQPDGSRLTLACLIQPGWILLMPRDAYGPGVQIKAPGVPGGPVGAAERAAAGQVGRASAGAQGPGSPAIPGAVSPPLSRPASAAPPATPSSPATATTTPTPATASSPATPSSPATATSPSTPASSTPPAPDAGSRAASSTTPAVPEGASRAPAEAGAAPAGTRQHAQQARQHGHQPGPHDQQGRPRDRAGHGHRVGSEAAGLPPGPSGGGLNGGGPHGGAPHGSGPHASGAQRGPHASGAQRGPHGSGAQRGPGGGGPSVAAPLSPHNRAFPYELAGASLLAAGVLAALGRRRRAQARGRAFGTRTIMPEGEAALAETALRLGASEPGASLLDVAMRSMAAQLGQQGREPPGVFAAHLGQVNLDLWVTRADEDPPEPWLSVDDGQVWRLPLAAAASLDPGPVLAPYPGLVSIGSTETGQMLIDLEVPRGIIAVRGPRHVAAAALAAMAVELATARWSDLVQVTAVGFSPELAMVAPDRLTVAATLEDALAALRVRAAELEDALAAAGVGSVLAGRAEVADPDLWAPHYLITAEPPSAQQREELLALANVPYRTALGYVVAGELPGATWTFDVTSRGALLAGELGFDLDAQLLPPHQYAAVAELFRDAEQAGGVALADPPPDLVPPGHLDPEAVMAVEVGLLGQVRVQAPGSLEPNRAAIATEIVAYLAAHPGGVHPSVLTAVIWPRGVTSQVRDAALARVDGWLGTDDTGLPNLLAAPPGRISLGPQVRVDWQVFCALVAHAALARQAGQDDAEMDYLARALGLVRGPLLDGRDRRRYAWLAADPLEYEVTARVADAAHRLSWLLLTAGDPDGAMAAARTGLRLADCDEPLWRDLLTAAHATGRADALHAAVDEVSARVPAAMAPETEALIDELLPSWRTSVA